MGYDFNGKFWHAAHPSIYFQIVREMLTFFFLRLVWTLCLYYQHFSILHHRTSGTGVIHSRRSRQDVLYCGHRVDHIRTSSR